MKHKFALSALALMLPAAAMAQTQSPPPAPSASPMTSGTTAADLSMQDKTFIQKAAYSGLSEVSDGQLAESKGNASVQQVATRMVTDHSKANDQLATLSASLGDPAPTTTNTMHMKIHASLESVSGSAFDQKYLKTQLQGHETTIALFKAEASSGKNSQLKQFASQTLPILQMHLSMIKSAMSS